MHTRLYLIVRYYPVQFGNREIFGKDENRYTVMETIFLHAVLV